VRCHKQQTTRDVSGASSQQHNDEWTQINAIEKRGELGSNLNN
jgi:hypothetical protein